MKFVLLIMVCVFFSMPPNGNSQYVQWASKVLKYSSQYSDTKSAAKQALGKPNCLPTGGDSPMAWAVEQLGDNESWLEATLKLGYSNPMEIRQVAIGESCAPGAIIRVVLTDTEGNEHVIYTAEPQKVKERARMLNIFLPLTDYKVEAVTLILQPGKVSGWNEIDAVGISDSEDSVKASIHLATTVVYKAIPENLGTAINSKYSDAIDAIAPDGKTLFISRVNHPDNIGGVGGGRDVWYSTLRDDSTWTPAVNIGAPINNEGNNYVNSISPDGNTLLLGNLYKPDGSSAGRGLSMTHKTQDGWSKPENLKIRNLISKSNHAEYALSPDGKTILMSIEADETHGFNDLYATFLTETGEWSEPINLGETINTPGNENGPFLAADGVTLYYSTNGLSGYGSNDLFITRRLDDSWMKWSEPENLGPGINTAKFDAGYSLTASGSFAYFTSTANSMGEDDVFRIVLSKEAKPQPVMLLSGHVYNAKTKLPIDATITYKAVADSSHRGTTHSNRVTGEYKTILPAGNEYSLRVESKNYYAMTERFSTATLTEYQEFTKDIYLNPIVVGQTFRLNNMFFEFAKADLKPESFIELDNVVQFMSVSPTVEIQIAGHTDNVGSDEDNITLSENRAQAVLNYIISHGIDSSRITSRGYGKSKPEAPNDTEEGRQLNRRVEFTITKE